MADTILYLPDARGSNIPLRVVDNGDGTYSLAAATPAASLALAGGIPSVARLLSSAATTNSTLVKASAGRLFAVQGYNASGTVAYLKIYNKATAPTIGTDVPVKTIALPATTIFALDWPLGLYFPLGIGFGLTTAVADNSTAAVAAADILGLNFDYA